MFKSLQCSDSELTDNLVVNYVSSSDSDSKKDITQKQHYTLVLLGNEKCGKTEFTKTFLSSNNIEYNAPQSTIGILDGYTVRSSAHGRKIFIKLIDIPHKIYHNVSEDAIKNADGFILMYDVSSKAHDMRDFVQDIFTIQSTVTSTAAVLVGNLINKTRQLSQEFGKKMAKELLLDKEMPFFEISVKDGKSVEKVIETLIEQVDECAKEEQIVKKQLRKSVMEERIKKFFTFEEAEE